MSSQMNLLLGMRHGRQTEGQVAGQGLTSCLCPPQLGRPAAVWSRALSCSLGLMMLSEVPQHFWLRCLLCIRCFRCHALCVHAERCAGAISMLHHDHQTLCAWHLTQRGRQLMVVSALPPQGGVRPASSSKSPSRLTTSKADMFELSPPCLCRAAGAV